MDLDKIEEKLDLVTAGATEISMDVGGIRFQSMAELFEMAKLMSLAKTAVPKHLRGNPGACLAVCIQALEWRMSPFAVANKSYEVNDRIAYESQLIVAVLNARAPLQERLRYTYEGEGVEMKCTVSGVIKGEATALEYESPQIKNIKVKNSPLWTSDPKQQLGYYSARSWARRHCPDVLLGIYAEDELREEGDGPRDITPATGLKDRLTGAKDGSRGFSAEHVAGQIGHSEAVVLEGGVAGKDAVPVAAQAEPATKGRKQKAPASEAPKPSDAADAKPDLTAEWLDERIAEANNLKDMAALDELDPAVWKRLDIDGRKKDLGPKWEAEGFEANRARITGVA